MDMRAALASSNRVAASFLQQSQGGDGLWRDFVTLAGASTEWITGVVVDACSRYAPMASACAAAVTPLLHHQRPDGGWGYNSAVPSDADSTSWCSLALSDARCFSPDAGEAASRYLLRHRSNDGGFSTYSRSDRVGQYIGAVDEEFTHGWRRSHPCVTATAMLALRATASAEISEVQSAAAAYLVSHYRADGGWSSYWWPGGHYVAYLAIRALQGSGSRVGQREISATYADLRDQRDKSGAWVSVVTGQESAFDTAVCLSALLNARDPLLPRKEISSSVTWLLDAQLKDGGWPASAVLCVPSPRGNGAEDARSWWSAGAGGGLTLDINRVFSTTAVLRALLQSSIHYG